MRGFFIPLLYFLLANATTVAICNKKFGKCFPITLLLSAFPLFFSGLLFGTFTYGVIINIIYALVFIPLVLKRKKEFIENYFSNGFYACLILYLVVFVHNIGRAFSEWDEFSHWGMMVKEMLRLDNFYSIDASTLFIHKDYPPIIPVFNLFWAKLSGGYEEVFLLNAMKFLVLSFLLPVIENFKAKNKKQLFSQAFIVILIATFVSLFFDRERVFNTIYLECFVGFSTAYILYDIFTNEDLLSSFSLFKYCVLLSFFLLTKQICIPLYIMVSFLFVSRLLQERKKTFKEKAVLKIICILLFVVAIPSLNLLIWNNYTANYNVDRQFVVSDIEISKLPGILAGTGGDYSQQRVGYNATDGLFSRSITTSYLEFSYIHCAVIGVVLLYLIYKKYKKIYNRELSVLLIITVILGFIGYAFVIVTLYIFCFYPEEGYVLNSFDRYLDSFVLGMFILCLMLYLHGLYNSEENIFKKSLIILAVVFCIQGPYGLKGLEYFNEFTNSKKYYIDYAEKLNKNVPVGSKVFQICQFVYNNYSSGEYTEFFEAKRYQYYVHYYTNGIIMNPTKNNFKVDDYIDGKTFFDENIKEEMLKYDYVFLTLYNDAFVEKYSFLYEDINSIRSGNIFKIIVDEDNNVVLRQIDNYVE